MEEGWKKINKGFTLLELLIVIGILAVLATVAVLVINPMEYIKQSRDAKRIGDIVAITRGLSLAEAENISLGASTTVSISIPDNASSTCGSLGLPELPLPYQYRCVSASSTTKTDGSGWVPVNFGGIGGGAPLASLPVDPLNEAVGGRYYTYIPGGSFEVTSTVESQKYLEQAAADGGVNVRVLEKGTRIGLTPVMTKKPSQIKVLVIYKQLTCGSVASAVSQMTSAGMTVIEDFTVDTQAKVDAYAPDVIAALDSACAIPATTTALVNLLFDKGYSIYTSGNDTTAVLRPITLGAFTTSTAGIISPWGSHYISKGWTSTANSGGDNRFAITGLRAGGVPISKDATLGYIEDLYYEEINKGRWYHHQPTPAPDVILQQNALKWLVRQR